MIDTRNSGHISDKIWRRSFLSPYNHRKLAMKAFTCMLCAEFLRPVPDIRNLIYRDKRLWITGTDMVHERLVFALIDDRDDLVVLLKIVSTGGFIDRGPAVQVVDDELAEFLFLFSDNADTPLDVLIENKVVEDDPVHICTEDTEYDRLFVLNQCGGERHAHSVDGHGLSDIHVHIFIHDLRNDIKSAG